MTLEQISDRLEIQDLMVAYSHAIDFQRWDELDDVFTPDAHIDYSVFGAPAGPYPEIKAYLIETLSAYSDYFHMISTSKVTLDGDTATGVTICNNPMTLPGTDGATQLYLFGLWYHDTFVRTELGWRISSRVEQKAFVQALAPRRA